MKIGMAPTIVIEIEDHLLDKAIHWLAMMTNGAGFGQMPLVHVALPLATEDEKSEIVEVVALVVVAADEMSIDFGLGYDD